MKHLYSFIIPYYHRPKQFRETLCSYVHFYGDRSKEVQIVIVLDEYNMQQTQAEVAKELVAHFDRLFDVVILMYNKPHYNPAPLYNAGVEKSNGEYLVITNPECRHEVNVLGIFDEEFSDGIDKYVVCSCVALKEDGTFFKWFHHSLNQPTYYHFCSALPRTLYDKIGGFCEEYAMGYCFEDNDFRDRLSQYIVARDDAFVTHLWHRKNRPSNWRILWERNKRLYERRKLRGFN